MEFKLKRISVTPAGGNASQNALTSKLTTIPPTWMQAMGITKDDRK